MSTNLPASPSEPERAWLLATLVGEAATGRPVEELPSSEQFAAWVDELLRRTGCDQAVQLEPVRPPSLLAPALTDAPGGPGRYEKFVLRNGLTNLAVTYRHLLSPRPPVDPALLERFAALLGERPAPVWKFQQAPVELESTLRRAMEVRRVLGPGLHSVLMLGDDDATSVALSLLEPSYRIWIVDIDENILQMVARAGATLQADFTTENLDLRHGVPVHLAGRFTAVVTDPVRDFSICRQFLRFAAACLSRSEPAWIFWADHPEWTVGYGELLAELPRLGLRCETIVAELHSYPMTDYYIHGYPQAEPIGRKFLETLDEVARAFGLDPQWVRTLAEHNRTWSHLHVLARAEPSAPIPAGA